MVGIGSFIVPVLALLVSLGGAVGLFLLRRRRPDARVIARAACPRCRYELAPGTATCSECGADLAGRGVVDASWPTWRFWVGRAVLVAVLCVPIPLVLAGPVRTLVPIRNRTTTITVLGLVDPGGVPREVLAFGEQWTWFGRGNLGMAPATPAGLEADTWYLVPPENPAERMTSPDDDESVNPPDAVRASLGDAAYRRVSRDAVGDAGRRGLELADAILKDGDAAAAAAVGRARTAEGARGGGAGTSSNGRGTPTTFDRIQLVRWTYGRAAPNTVVPLARRTFTRSSSLAPPPDQVVLGALGLGGLLLVRGLLLARRYRPRAVESAG